MSLLKIPKFLSEIFTSQRSKDLKKAVNDNIDQGINVYHKNSTSPQYFKISTLNFIPLKEQIIYIESTYNTFINNQIITNYDELLHLSTLKGLDLFYLPIKKEQITSPDLLSYYYPRFSINISIKLDDSQFNYDSIISNIKSEHGELCGFIRCIRNEEDGYLFSYFELTNKDILPLFKQYLSLIKFPTVLYSLGSPDSEDDKADFHFNLAAYSLIDEIKDRLEKLRMLGMGQSMLESLLLEKPKISRLVITKDYRILLPDYEIEVDMHPLPKAVYLLFLKHPEGIIFKNLTDYRYELINIYKKITRSDDLSKIVFSINDITDPTKNSINEKCSRIKEAFVKKIDISIAVNYIIKGDRGEPKLIKLDNELIINQTEL